MANDMQQSKANSNLKQHKAEDWEINEMGNFLLDLYHRQVFSHSTDWNVSKQILRTEFKKYLNEDLRGKFEELNGTTDVGTLLFRSKYLINTPRGCDFFRINKSSFVQYRNKKLEEYDEKRKNGERDTTTSNSSGANNIYVDPLAALHEVDENAEENPLEYIGMAFQDRDASFGLTSMGCYICQINFSSPVELEQHIEEHGDGSDFKFAETLTKFGGPMFNVSYKLCKKSHYFCFALESSMHDVLIEKIIIVQANSFYYVHNARVPYELTNERDVFYVDSHLFTKFLEQPIVIVFRSKAHTTLRIVEQHHFMRIEEFPAVAIQINPNRLPNKVCFKTSLKLQQYLPTSNVCKVLSDPLAGEGTLYSISSEFKNYLLNNKSLTEKNYRQTLNALLQVEDFEMMREYKNLMQDNVKLRRFGDEYSLQLKTSKAMFLENILSQYDDVIVVNKQSLSQGTAMNDDIYNIKFEDTKTNKDKGKDTNYFGVVERVRYAKVTFVCSKKIPEDKLYTVIFRPSRMVQRYQYRTLENLLTSPKTHQFLSTFLFPKTIEQHIHTPKSFALYNKNINENAEQLQAIQQICNDREMMAPYIIFGPPGTGKTTTVVEAILQLYSTDANSKILITASTNSACDEVALRLCKILSEWDHPKAIVRIYSRSCDRRVDSIDDTLLENSNLYGTHFYPAVDVVHEYRIVVCTLSVVGKLAMGRFGKNAKGTELFTHVFIDEVAASTECETLMGVVGILSAKAKLILSGDHKQLGPVLKSNRAIELGLGKSMMERLLDRECYRVEEDGTYNKALQTRLRCNYRSHPEIVNLYNCLYYGCELRPMMSSDVTGIGEEWHRAPNKNYPIIFHSVFGTVDREKGSVSLYNLRELNVVMEYVKDLMYFGVKGRKIAEDDIGIISPYKKQYERIKEELNLRNWYHIETGSVETFQGKEKDIIIISFVRSFSSTLGFLDNPRRLNVALSRAKSLLILVGNPKTLSLNTDFKYIIDECKSHGTMIGADYYEGDLRPTNDQQMKKLTKSVGNLSVNNKKYGKNKNSTKNAVDVNAKPQHEHIGKSMKKNAKPISQQKQRETFEAYKNLVLTEQSGDENKSSATISFDELFECLPRTPGREAASLEKRENITQLKKDIDEKLARLKIKRSPSKIGSQKVAGPNNAPQVNNNIASQPSMYSAPLRPPAPALNFGPVPPLRYTPQQMVNFVGQPLHSNMQVPHATIPIFIPQQGVLPNPNYLPHQSANVQPGVGVNSALGARISPQRCVNINPPQSANNGPQRPIFGSTQPGGNYLPHQSAYVGSQPGTHRTPQGSVGVSDSPQRGVNVNPPSNPNGGPKLSTSATNTPRQNVNLTTQSGVSKSHATSSHIRNSTQRPSDSNRFVSSHDVLRSRPKKNDDKCNIL